MAFFLINGLYRSGTTLLQKLLCSHPSLSVAYQPTLDFLIDTKKQFYQSIGHPETYAYLGPCFNETRYRPQDFDAYLGETGFIDTYRQKLREAAHKPDAPLLGAREMMSGEYIPYLLHHDFRVIMIIRDVRDVIASASVTQTHAYMGKPLPTLYNIRNWRKNVAFTLACRDHPHFFFLRYEDLVTDTEKSLNDICRFLDVDAFDPAWIEGGIRDEYDNPWTGNSSDHAKAGIDRASIGRFKNVLDEDTQRYIKACASPELMGMGFTQTPYPDPEKIIGIFVEPFPMERAQFPADYTHSAENRELELLRIALLKNGRATQEEQYRYFIFPEVYAALRQYV